MTHADWDTGYRTGTCIASKDAPKLGKDCHLSKRAWRQGLHVPSGTSGMQGASEDVVQAQIAPAPEDPQPLSEEEIAEKERLMTEGYSNWNRRDFNAFVRACEKVRALIAQAGSPTQVFSGFGPSQQTDNESGTRDVKVIKASTSLHDL